MGVARSRQIGGYMFGKHKTDVLVSGAGPVGLFAAASLAARGVGVDVIDKAWRTAARSYALALHPRSLEMLEGLGLADEILRRGCRVDTVGLYDAKGKKADIGLAELGGPFPFVVVMPQCEIEELLVNHLEQQKVPIRWNHRLTGIAGDRDLAISSVEQLEKVSGGYAVTQTEWEIIKTHSFRTSFVIGADGHRSIVRRELGSDFPAVAPAEFFAVIEFETDTPVGHEMAIVVDGDALSAFWPLGENRGRWSFGLQNSGSPGARFKSRLSVEIGEQTFPHLDESHLRRLVANRAPWFEPAIRSVDWCTGVRFEKRLAGSFGGGRLWLAGDAAHMTGPVGIQSMNVGMLEAHDLAEHFAAILVDGAPEGTLDGYARHSRERWTWHFSGLDSSCADGGADPWIEACRGHLVESIPASGDALNRLLAQVGLAATCPSKG